MSPRLTKGLFRGMTVTVVTAFVGAVALQAASEAELNSAHEIQETAHSEISTTLEQENAESAELNEAIEAQETKISELQAELASTEGFLK